MLSVSTPLEGASNRHLLLAFLAFLFHGMGCLEEEQEGLPAFNNYVEIAKRSSALIPSISHGPKTAQNTDLKLKQAPTQAHFCSSLQAPLTAVSKHLSSNCTELPKHEF